MCKPLKSRFSFPSSSIVFLHTFPVGYQSLMFWVLISPVHDLRLRVTDKEFKSFTLQENEILADYGMAYYGVHISASSAHIVAVPCREGFVHPASKSPSEGIIPYVVIDVFMGGCAQDLPMLPS